MKQVRLALYFVLGIFLGGFVVLSHAETIPSVSQIRVEYWSYNTPGSFVVPQDLCNARSIALGYGAGYLTYNYGGSSCRNPGGTPMDWANAYNQNALTCPAGQNWTLSGSTCTRPDCVSPQTMQSDGTCKAPACPAGQHVDPADPAKCQPDCIGDQIQQSDGTCKCALTGSKTVSYVVPPGGVGSYASDCLNNCKQSISSSGFCPSGVVTAFTGGSTTCYTRATPTGATCNSVTGVPMPPLEVKVAPPPAPSDTTGTAKDNVTPDSKNTPDNNKDPVACGAAGGSYGTYNGVSKCLTPSANDQVAKVSDISGTVTNADGSTVKTLKQVIQIQGGPDSPGFTETITTKQTCTAAGVCTSSSASSTVQSPSTTSSGNGSASNGWTGSGSSSGTGHQY